MKWLQVILSRFHKPQAEMPGLTDHEITCIVGLACSNGPRSHDHWRARAVEAYRNALKRGVPLRSNIYMDYMAEIDHVCPDNNLRLTYRDKIRKKHKKGY